MNSVDYLIIGGGPTGLGAACRLQQEQCDWALIEEQGRLGGLSASVVDKKGFTWDMGGHVMFSHYDEFDHRMDAAIGTSGWLKHIRKSMVWIRNRFVPYPFQNNLHRLDSCDRWRCVEGLLEASKERSSGIANFEEWMTATMGSGIVEMFLRPYNFKVWAYPPKTMGYDWIGERVAVTDLKRVLRSICTGEDNESWGPNNTFRFPAHGGTGAFWNAVGSLLPAERITMGCGAVEIDVARKEVLCLDGRKWKYKTLISSMPLHRLASIAGGVVSGESCLRYSSVHVVGVGMDGEPPESLKTMCWMYFPELNSPYFRVTVFSNYSPNNVPCPGKQWSLMAEVSSSPSKVVDGEKVVDDVIRALREDGLMPSSVEPVSVVHYEVVGYPTPFLGRDGVVEPMLRSFEERSVYSRGRFGAWKYEVSNQDHCYMQGWECAGRLIAGGGQDMEPTLFTPWVVNKTAR